MKKLLSTALTALLLLPLQLFAADANGVWKASFETQVGVQNYTYTFMVDGSTVTGTIETANGEATMTDGKIDGTTISFTENLTYQGMPLVITYTGEIVSDNEISFTRSVAGITETLTATRE